MDDICFWLEKLLSCIDRGEVPSIPYVGRASGRFYNPPAEHIEICYVLEGEYQDLRIGDNLVCIPEQHVSFHSVHFGNYSSPVKSRIQCLFFDVSKIHEFDSLKDAPLFCCMPVRNQEELIRAFETVQIRCLMPGDKPSSYLKGPVAYACNKTPGSVRPFRVKAVVLELLACLLENARVTSGRGEHLPAIAVRIAVQFIGLQYSNPHLSLEDIAEAANLSVDHFGRLFRLHMSTTPMRYLKSKRIDQSLILLHRTGLLIEEVAHETGFKDPLHFSRAFRSIVGMSPKEYRERTRARDCLKK